LRPDRSRTGRDRRGDGHADHAVHEPGRLARRNRCLLPLPPLRRDQALSRQPAREPSRRRRRDGRRRHGRRLRQPDASRRPLPAAMNACILAIGSEMLTPFRVDTNSLFITERLNAIGYDVRLKAVVADEVEELARVIDSAMAWADLIVVTGGLGPTEDDVTRDAVARALGTPLDVDESIVERIPDRFARPG